MEKESSIFEYDFDNECTVTIFKNRVELNHHGIVSKATKGVTGKIIIYIKHLSGIEYHKSTSLTNGYVELVALGFPHASSFKTKQDNVFSFISKEDDDMARVVVDIINGLID